MRPAAHLAIALLLLATAPVHASTPSAPGKPQVLPFIDDDYAKALEEARRRKVPIFVEAWAPWCHTCRSMKAYVFTDDVLAPEAPRFVWLAVDTEKAVNAPFKEKYPIEALPTFLVVDPVEEKVILRWVGGATVEQLQAILKEAASGRRKQGIEQILARADRYYGAGNHGEAVKSYEQVLAKAPKDFPQYARTVDSLLFSLQQTDAAARGVELATEALPRVKGTTSEASVAAGGLACSLALPADRADRKALVTRFEAATRAALENPALTLAADDRSGMFIALLEARQDAKDEEGARKVATEWSAFLEKAAAAAATPDQRAVFDSHRLAAYIELGQPEKAVPMLEASERDLPSDYNPPARLAVALSEMKRYDEALAACGRAMAKIYGPRKVRVYLTRADVEKAKGDVAAARATLEEAIRYVKELPPAQRSERTIKSLEEKLAKL